MKRMITAQINTTTHANSANILSKTLVQMIHILEGIKVLLSELDLALDCLIKTQESATVDSSLQVQKPTNFDGLMVGYHHSFATTKHPELPVRSVLRMDGVLNSDCLVDIEVTMVR